MRVKVLVHDDQLAYKGTLGRNSARREIRT